jgi:arginine utilization protein RocB
VCSTAFATLGQAQARALGHPDLPIAVIAHPFGIRTREEVRQIAAQCVEEIVKLVSKDSAK